MSKKVLTLAQKHGYANILLGISCLSIAIVDLIGNFTSEFVGSIVSFICTSLVFISFFIKAEIDDERSEQNLYRAGHKAFLILLILFALLNLVFLHFDYIALEPKIITRSFLGLGALLYGSLFLYYEKEGY